MSINTETKRYLLRNHAIDRIRARYGYRAHEATEWVNDLMQTARYLSDGHNGSKLYESEEGVRLYIDKDGKTVVTVHSEVSTSFLTPVLKREIRKLDSQYTKEIRENELELGLTNRRYGEMTINYANAKNPNTRELISKRAESERVKARRIELKIERLIADKEAKIHAVNMMIE